MDRRNFLQGTSALLALGSQLSFPAAKAQEAEPPNGLMPFGPELVKAEARRLAATDFEPQSGGDMPSVVADLDYHQYRDIRFRAESRIWSDRQSPFQIDLFHPGFLFKDKVEIALVDNGTVRPVAFSTAMFDYGPGATKPEDVGDIGFSGFRVRSLINTPGYWDEFLVFQGASYFRAVARGQSYGLSARGLAIGTASPEGEEFPVFRKFWLEQPEPDAMALVVHALLDSPSTTGAYRFVIGGGAETLLDVDAEIYPREEIDTIGLAPQTSMFMFNGTNPAAFDDFRPAVHDSDGLQMLTGNGEWIWRPLANPVALQISNFQDDGPRGFGLVQRARSFDDFEDYEAAYERRPSLWIEPLGNWGKGSVELVEIPTEMEIHDNIVAYWRPEGVVPEGEPYSFAYRMRWTDIISPQLGMLVTQQTRVGLTFDGERRLFVVDFTSTNGTIPQDLTAHVSGSAGTLHEPVIHGIVPGGALRVAFELETGDEPVIDLRLVLRTGETVASETWLYRWTPR